MRFKIVSRIFAPEPSAASFRLESLAAELSEAGHVVDVLTVNPPTHLAALSKDEKRGYDVRRLPVRRDSSGYVRGYLSYLSFDLPLFFRIVFGSRADAIIVEPPPTTGFFVRIAAAIRRIPYTYYAADVWSDAARLTGSPPFVLRLLTAIEKWALSGAKLVFAVSPGVEERLVSVGVRAPIVMVGNGVDVTAFSEETVASAQEPPLFVYGGTASEWHGAEVFLRAMKIVRQHSPSALLTFVGGGSEKKRLAEIARDQDIEGIEFTDPVPPAELGERMSVATASLASVRPGTPYEFAFPTKLYSSTIVGVPLIYAGSGPAVEYVRTEVDGLPIGVACRFSIHEVAEAMIKSIEESSSFERRTAVASWGRKNVGLDAVAGRIRVALEVALNE